MKAAWRRHHRQRMIRKRWKTVLNEWPRGMWSAWAPYTGRFAKSKVHNCSCFMCQYETYDRREFKADTRQLLDEQLY